MMPHIEASAPTECLCHWPEGCVCLPAEKALRLFSAGSGRAMPRMTPEQREECLREIARVEGYRREDYESASDASLATGVLHAWVDFCRDKGLL